MGRCLFKIIVLSILGCIAFFCIRLAYSIFEEDIRNWRNSVQQEEVANISASVSDLILEHNVTIEGQNGMNIYSKQVYKNLEGTTCYYMLRFFDDNGKPLKGKTYKDEDGDFCMIGKIEPDSDNCVNDQRIFVAYNQFDIPDNGTVHFLCDIRLFIIDQKGDRIELAYSNPCRFHLSY